mgnify:CR=1 FL=1
MRMSNGVKRALWSVWGLAGLVLLPAVDSSPAVAQALPAGWVADRAPGGSLYVPHPPGWVVQERDAGAFIVYRAGAGPVAEALVYVKPQRFGANRNAADVLGLLPREEVALFPEARVLRGRPALRERTMASTTGTKKQSDFPEPVPVVTTKL